jgi:hypothetical protein
MHINATKDIAKQRVLWNGDGTYTPTCETCRWEGKARVKLANAVQAVRQHDTSGNHIANLRRGVGL